MHDCLKNSKNELYNLSLTTSKFYFSFSFRLNKNIRAMFNVYGFLDESFISFKGTGGLL
jgi:hypothetical protein